MCDLLLAEYSNDFFDEYTGTIHSEIQYVGLNHWWARHNKVFSEWFLLLSSDEQKDVILACCPDIPLTLQSQSSNSIKPSDKILPELNLESLLSLQGKLLILFITRRCVSTDYCYLFDLKLLKDLEKLKILPNFCSNDVINNNIYDTPFINPLDRNDTIQCIPPDADEKYPSLRSEIYEHFESGRLVQINVWLALKIRRLALVNFFVALFEYFQSKISNKVSPNLQALIKAEIEQRKTVGHGYVETTDTDDKVT